MTRHHKAIALTRGVDSNPAASFRCATEAQAGPELLTYCV